jgi:hypothetical protein
VNSFWLIPPSLAEPPHDGNPLFYCISTNSCSEPNILWKGLLFFDVSGVGSTVVGS